VERKCLSKNRWPLETNQVCLELGAIMNVEELRKRILEIDNSISQLEQEKRLLRYELRSLKQAEKAQAAEQPTQEAPITEEELAELRRKLLS